jgi:hypothetical protein
VEKNEKLNISSILDLERVIKRPQAPLLDEMKTLTKKVKFVVLAIPYF